MKTVKIKLDHTAREDIHDGIGGIHLHDAVVKLPADVADQFVALGFAMFLDGSSAIKAREEQKAVNIARVQEIVKARAEQSSTIYDEMPPEWRKRVQEEGDGVIEDYLASRPSMPLEEYEAAEGEPFVERRDAEMNAELMEQPKRKRGRPPKLKPTPEGGETP